MNSQEPSAIPVSYEWQQHTVRLLELSPELQDLLQSDEAHVRPLFYLKSGVSSSQDGDQDAGHAFLCTADRTFQLHQVQTSNTVFILKNSSPAGDTDNVPRQTLSIFATCSSVLETQPLEKVDTSKLRSARDWLTELLPVLDDTDTLSELPDDAQSSQQRLFEDVPYSVGECKQAFRELHGLDYGAKCMRPSTALLRATWIRALDAIGEVGLDIDNRFSIRDLNLDYNDDNVILVSSLLDDLRAEGDLADDDSIKIDREETVKFVAVLILATSSAPETLTDSGKLEQVRSLLPGNWALDIGLEDVEKHFPSNKDESGSTSSKGKAASGQPAKRPGPRVNWHEKFKKGRK